MLIVFAGLPGTGKTTLARELALRLPAVYLRIDTLEQAILRSGIVRDAGPAGYFAAYALAEENLRLGAAVVVDAVNALAIIRESWREVAKSTAVPVAEIEVICSDVPEHRRRVEGRTPDIAGHRVPDWQDVLSRPYEPWNHEPAKDDPSARQHLVIDTAGISASQSVNEIARRLKLNLSR